MSLNKSELVSAIRKKYRRFDAATIDDIVQDARADALVADPGLTGRALETAAEKRVPDVVERRRDDARRGNQVARGNQDKVVEAAAAGSLLPRPRPRMPRAPDLPANSLLVKASEWCDLTDYLFSYDEKLQRVVPGWFIEWCKRVEDGDEDALKERLAVVAERLARTLTLTAFRQWWCRPEIAAKRLSIRTALNEWVETEPSARDEVRAAFAAPFDWLCKPSTIVAYVPVRSRPDPSPSAFLAARLLNDRIVQPFLNSKLLSIEHQEVLPGAFRAAFGIDIDSAWILAFLDEVELAQLTRRNTEIRVATPTGDEQARFNVNRDVPAELFESAAIVLKRTCEKIDTWAYGLKVPSPPAWLNSQLTALLIMRYGFDTGGGPNGKLSRKSLVKLLDSPKDLLTNVEQHGRSLAERVTDAEAKVIQRRYRDMTEQLRRAMETATAEPARTVRRKTSGTPSTLNEHWFR